MLRIFRKSLKTGIVTTDYPKIRTVPATSFQGLPEWQEQSCNQCGLCADVCPTKAINLQSELVQLKLNIETSVTKASSGGFCQSRISQKEHLAAKVESTPTEAEYRVPLPLVEVGVSRLDGKIDSFWTVDPKKCIFCGYCVDVCQQAIVQGGQYELAESVVQVPHVQAFKHSVHIRHLDSGSCNACEWEMTTLTGPVYDIQRLGFDFVPSPRHADVLMVTGPVTRNLEIAVRKTFAATPAPKLVLAVGTCACSGGICGKSYASSGGVDNIIPVDVFIPGCPPRPQALIQGLLKAVGKT